MMENRTTVFDPMVEFDLDFRLETLAPGIRSGYVENRNTRVDASGATTEGPDCTTQTYTELAGTACGSCYWTCPGNTDNICFG